MQRFVLYVFVFLFVFFSFSANIQAQTSTTYVVARGDSLWGIAEKYEINVADLIKVNPQILQPSLIHPDQNIIVPLFDQMKKIEHLLIDLTNQVRTSNGLDPLLPHDGLSKVARLKANDMRDNLYFSHISPVFGSPVQMLSNFDIAHMLATENIAQGQTTCESVMESWMDSPSHRENILSTEMTHVGVGYAKGGSGRHYWTQVFISQ